MILPPSEATAILLAATVNERPEIYSVGKTNA